MVTKNERGWWWHFQIYNYITKEMHAFTSIHPFDSYNQALVDLTHFLEAKHEESMQAED